MSKLDLNAPATLELRPDWREQRLQGPDNIRFETAAAAVKFAVESQDLYRITGACLRAGDTVLDLAEMRRIYEGPDFPLPKRLRPAT